jgi:hypothetical protein
VYLCTVKIRIQEYPFRENQEEDNQAEEAARFYPVKPHCRGSPRDRS